MLKSLRIFLWVVVGLVPSFLAFVPTIPVQAAPCSGNCIDTGCTSPLVFDPNGTCPAAQPVCCVSPATTGCPGSCMRNGCTATQRPAAGTCSFGETCCIDNATGGPGSGATPTGGPGSTSVSFANPLRFTTVNELLTSLLTFLQTFIVMLALIFIIIGALLYVTSAGNDSRMETAKKCIMGAMVGLALGIAAPAFLREISNILGWNAGSASLPAGVGTSLSLLEIAANVLNFLLTVIGILAIIMLVIGGSMYLLAAGDEDRIDRGKKIVKYSIIGILIALGSMVLVRQIAAFFTP